MITTRVPEAPAVEHNLAEPSAALPSFRSLCEAACTVGALPLGVLLLLGKIWLAVSFALGVGTSLGVCGLLFLFVERVAPLLLGAARSRAGAAATQGTQLQFLLLLGAKLAVIALLGAAFLTLRHINSAAVLVGFMLAQTAIVLSAVRFRKMN